MCERTPALRETTDSPRAVVWRNAYNVSVTDGRFDRKIERFEGLCPVVKAPFAPLASKRTGTSGRFAEAQAC
jgi:hypothetical protein